jgi:hypothetical protein
MNSRKPDFYRVGIEILLERWQKCVDANGEYFEFHLNKVLEKNDKKTTFIS